MCYLVTGVILNSIIYNVGRQSYKRALSFGVCNQNVPEAGLQRGHKEVQRVTSAEHGNQKQLQRVTKYVESPTTLTSRC